MRYALVVVALAAFGTIAVAGCDPPCKPYWEQRCSVCGEDSPACEHAKLAAKNELGDNAKCESLTTSLKESSEFSQRRYCDLARAEARSLDEIRGPWICSGHRVEFKGPAEESKSTANPQQIVIDDAATTIFNVQYASFQREGGAACNYWLGEHEHSVGEKGLSILCPTPIGALQGEKIVHCLREGK
ncbi:MAG: hypothetical protein HOW73_40200 [Polyangiaceae bacterium]|nr:hypothetical protein [Polyangiaceae bacterium]